MKNGFVHEGMQYKPNERIAIVPNEVHQFVLDYAYKNYISSKTKLFPITERAVLKHPNAYGYGRPLAVGLIQKGYLVKDVNISILNRQAKHRGAMYRKSDSDYAGAIALAKYGNTGNMNWKSSILWTLYIDENLEYDTKPGEF